MKALTWQGRSDVRIDDVPDPRIEHPTDAVIRVTSTAICGSDLHLYDPLGPFLSKGDILGHETMGIVEEVGSEVTHISVGDRVVVPFNISCGHCWMCQRGFMAQCETTQVREQGMGASLFGFTELYGSVPGGQAEYLRVPQAQFGPILVPEGVADERFLYLSDILPTAWQGVEYADVPDGGSLAVIGLGSWRAIARLDMERRAYPMTVLHEYRMSPDDVLATVKWIGNESLSDLKSRTGISLSRLELVPLAVQVLRQLVLTFQPAEIAVSSPSTRSSASRICSTVAVSVMSWVVAPQCTNSPSLSRHSWLTCVTTPRMG